MYSDSNNPPDSSMAFTSPHEQHQQFNQAFDNDPHTVPMTVEPVRFQFSGRGRDYLSLWLTNWILTILTFGVYSAWAKVRRLQYVYQNTLLADYSFAFQGKAAAILMGRIIAVILLLLSYAGDFFKSYSFLVSVSSLFSLLIFLAFPWFVRTTMRFRARNSSYRNIRFSFRGTNLEIYKIYFLFGLATVFTLGLSYPYLAFRIKKYHIENSYWGNNKFRFKADPGSFFAVYLVTIGIGIVFYIAMIIITAVLQYKFHWMDKIDDAMDAAISTQSLMVAFFAVLFIVVLFTLFRLFNSITQDWLFKIIWNNTHINNSPFSCDLSIFKMYGLRWLCFLLSLATLGFFAPFAYIIILNARLKSLSLLPVDEFDLRQAALDKDTTRSAEVGDMFNLDIGW